MVVIHYTAMETCEAAAQRLCTPEHEVSAHYLISEFGEILQLVEEDQRAWHAGAGSWGGVSDVNSHSIGIELANAGSLNQMPPFPHAQMNALELLLGDVLARWSISAERVIGHSDMAPGRKADPGEKFDWRRLALLGLSVWPESEIAADVDEAAFLKAATDFGYGDVDPETLLTAIRLRFLPNKTGPLDGQDMGVIQSLASRYPVDPRRQTA